MRVAAVQHDICWEEAAATSEHLTPMIAGAAGTGARLIVLTEMYSTGFTMAPERVAEPPDGPSTAFLVDQARRHGVWLAASIPTVDPALPRPVNRLVLAGPDGRQHHYDKIHPFSYGGEHEHYAAGTRFLTVDVEGLRVSCFVCYDLRFADEFWAVARDTDCYVVVANWPAARRHHWRSLLTARAIENQAYMVGVNRVGADGNGVAHAGDSMIVDPLGEALATGAGSEAILVADVDAGVVAGVRARFPFLADRRSSVHCPAMTEVRAEITANVWQVRTEVGAQVAEGDELVILESMKMEIPVTAPNDGVVTEVRVAPEDKVQEGDVVAVLEP